MPNLYSTPIPVDNIKELSRSIFSFIPKAIWSKPLLFPVDIKQLFERSLVLPILERYNWTKTIEGVSVVVVPGGHNLQIHHDWGTLTHSFNIPILNCANTYTVWYDTDQESQTISDGGYTYCAYDAELCTEVERVELNQPYLFDVRKPHGVINPNLGTRLSLAIRLAPDFQKP